MNIELKNCLQAFKDCSLSIMEIVESEDYDELEIKIAERQQLLDEISKISYTKEEIRQIVERLEIIAVSERINSLINDKKAIFRNKIDEAAFKRNANENYNKSFYNNFHAFDKKI